MELFGRGFCAWEKRSLEKSLPIWFKCTVRRARTAAEERVDGKTGEVPGVDGGVAGDGCEQGNQRHLAALWKETAGPALNTWTQETPRLRLKGPGVFHAGRVPPKIWVS